MRPQPYFFRAWLVAFACGTFALASCNASPVDDRFDQNGELIALSGGDAGARAACHTCHGLDGSGDGALVPRIGGLDAGYLVRQLGFYADGQRRHPQMSWLAARLDSEERLAVALYYADMPFLSADVADQLALGEIAEAQTCKVVEGQTLYHDGAPSRGLASCASCHGADGTGVGRGNPTLVGQSPAYLVEQLRQWRSGERYGDPQGVMHLTANKLRESEITPLAEYIAYGPAPSHRLGSRAGCP